MHEIRTSAAALALATVAALAAGCGSDAGSGQTAGGGGTASTTASKEKGPIVVGAAIARTGLINAYDAPAYAAFKLYVDDVNAKGGVNGRKIQVKVRDTASTPDGSKAAAEKLLQDGAQILVTNCNFDFGSPAGIAAQAQNKLNISLCAASPKYGVQGIGPQAYTPAPAAALEGYVLADYAVKRGWKSPYVLTDNSLDYPNEVCDGFKTRWKELAKGPLAGEDTFKNGDKSIASQITKIKGANADVVVACTYTPGGASALRQIRGAGISLPILSDLAMGGVYWLKAVPNLSAFYVTANKSIYGDDPDPTVNAFVKAHTKATGAPPASDLAVEGYAAGQVLVGGIRDAGGSTDGPTVSAALDKWKARPTLAGDTTYTPETHIAADRPLAIIKYTNGKPAYEQTITTGGTVDLKLGG